MFLLSFFNFPEVLFNIPGLLIKNGCRAFRRGSLYWEAVPE